MALPSPASDSGSPTQSASNNPLFLSFLLSPILPLLPAMPADPPVSCRTSYCTSIDPAAQNSLSHYDAPCRSMERRGIMGGGIGRGPRGSVLTLPVSPCYVWFSREEDWITIQLSKCSRFCTLRLYIFPPRYIPLFPVKNAPIGFLVYRDVFGAALCDLRQEICPKSFRLYAHLIKLIFSGNKWIFNAQTSKAQPYLTGACHLAFSKVNIPNRRESLISPRFLIYSVMYAR